MIRDIFTNKWILAGIGFLVIFAGLCYLWYQHTTAPYREQLAELNEIVRQSESQPTATTATPTETAADAPVESTAPTAEKSINETIHVTDKTKTTQAQAEVPAENTAATDVPVSPFGFGPYPEVPDGFPSNIRIPWRGPDVKYSDEGRMCLELAARVLIKLWNGGDTGFTGADITPKDLKVYPHYPDVIYVKYAEIQHEDGSVSKSIVGLSGGANLPEITSEMLESGVVPGFRLVEKEAAGIDALDFLNL